MYMNNNKTLLAEFKRSVPQRQAEYWTEEEEQDCISSYLEGEDISSLAMKYQRSEIAVFKKLDSKGVCDFCKRSRQKNKPKCKCADCIHYRAGQCSGGEMCKKENPPPADETDEGQ